MQALEDTLRKPTSEEQLAEIARQNAAVRIQKAWRQRMRKKYLGPDFLWTDLAIHARMKVRHHVDVRSTLPCQDFPVRESIMVNHTHVAGR